MMTKVSVLPQEGCLRRLVSFVEGTTFDTLDSHNCQQNC